MAKIAIIGTGYVGTSIGLALKARRANLEIVGHDREFGRAGEAKKRGALDRAEWNLPATLEGAAMVVVATPVQAIDEVFELIARFVEPGCVVTDTAALKGPVLQWAEKRLAGRAHFVGGHPIVGEVGGERVPSATLFEGRTYCVVPAPVASNEAVDQVVRLAHALGAIPLFLDPAEHDSHVAAIGQLPTLLASTLVNLVTANPAWRDGQRLAGPTFGTATELALTDPGEQVAQLRANRATVQRWIGAMQAELAELSRLLELDAGDDLHQRFAAAQDRRAAWRPGLGPMPEMPSPELPRARDQFASWFLGRRGERKK